MPNLIINTEEKIEPKGFNHNQEIDQSKVKNYFFDDDFHNLNHLDNLTLSTTIKPTLFYPACGSDILFPLIYLEKLFEIKEAKLIFVDTDDNFNIIQTILNDIGIKFSKDNYKLKFYWKHILINLEYRRDNVFSLDFPSFDIYFERKFRIMKEDDSTYEHRIFKKLSPNGILISDSGYERIEMKRIKVPLELSPYGTMVIGVKDQTH